ncbi:MULTISPECIES: deoxyribonuclease IV [Thermodesulfovibrio]|jgi:deoxyribonuclease-4|uniref:deoxyribonuclease IV n=1 Tax=Thermodesulfovibrio TaxID=28261 RepID=UPI00262EBDE2|nr:deoxyribonuclease IV [Thermodesulfovibrio sp.]
MRPIGVHTSIKNTLLNSIAEAVELKCETFQIFLHSPQVWQIPEFEQNTIDEFKRNRQFYRLNPLIVHASYLINLISSTPKTISSSRYLLKREVQTADLLNADYYVIHLKDNKDMEKEEIYSKTKEGFNKIDVTVSCKILLENTAKSKITANIVDLFETFERVRTENVAGVCIDTCHLFAAGYDLTKDEGIERFTEEVRKYGDFGLIKLIHLNDSKTPAGSGIDRHENIGKGFIGEEGFKKFLKIKELSSVPLILETPKKSLQDDVKNLLSVRNILKTLES